MLREISDNIIRLILLLFIQGIILNEMDLGTLIVPYIYILFILKLPFETPKWFVLILSFGCGMFMDAFTNTPGLHISSCVFLGFVRPTVLRFYSPRDGYEYGLKPSVKSMGLTWFLYYSIWMVLSFNLWFFYMEVFNFSEFFTTLLRVIISSFFALLIIMITQYFSFGRKLNG